MRCFACGKEIGEETVCPECGYSFTFEDMNKCPDNDEGFCIITENPCFCENYINCQVKQQAEKEVF